MCFSTCCSAGSCKPHCQLSIKCLQWVPQMPRQAPVPRVNPHLTAWWMGTQLDLSPGVSTGLGEEAGERGGRGGFDLTYIQTHTCMCIYVYTAASSCVSQRNIKNSNIIKSSMICPWFRLWRDTNHSTWVNNDRPLKTFTYVTTKLLPQELYWN